MFRIKIGYYHELLMPETMKLLGTIKSKITKGENGENVYPLEIIDVVLVHCKTVNGYYQQDSRVFYTFFPEKWFGQLLDISAINGIFWKAFDSEILNIELWFTGQNSKLPEMKKKLYCSY